MGSSNGYLAPMLQSFGVIGTSQAAANPGQVSAPTSGTGNASGAGGGDSSMAPQAPTSSPATAQPVPLTQVINGQTGQGQQAFTKNPDGTYAFQAFDPYAWAKNKNIMGTNYGN